MNSIGNLALFPTEENSSKKAKTLIDITDDWLIEEIRRFTGINIDEFEKFSDITNIKELIEKRRDHYIKVFESDRQAVFSN